MLRHVRPFPGVGDDDGDDEDNDDIADDDGD